MKSLYKILAAVSVILIGVPAASAQFTPEFTPAPTPCCLPVVMERFAQQLQDWNQLGRYHADDVQLEKQPPVADRVVFFGDSITDNWDLAKFFPGKHYVNRGIGGQTTPQMLARMYADVVRLRPAAVVVLAGTNDIARNTGPETQEMVQDNLRAISELAMANRIRVILCLLTPVSDYVKKQTDHRPPDDIVNLNHWIASYAPDIHAAVVDYYSVLVDDKGMLRDGFSNDGLHPNDKGYALMAPVVEAAIESTLK
jgi:lysophospholipase L1-like esterase